MTRPTIEDPITAAQWRRRWRRNLPIAVFVLGVALLEGGYRVVDAWRERSLLGFRVDDLDRGWALRPGFRGWITGEADLFLEINSAGMRDREHALAKPPGTVRVAILGDSYMQAQNLPFDKTLAPLLERRLRQCAARRGRDAEVLNFGVSGYGTAQELLTYRLHANRYRPDVVMLAFYSGNDVFDNHRDLHESFSDHVPFFVLRDGRLVLEPPRPEQEPATPWFQRVRMAFTDRSIVASRIWNLYALFRSPFVPLQVEDVASPFTSPAVSIYVPPASGPLAEAWAVTEALLLNLSAEVAADGAELWLVTLANREQHHPNVDVRRSLADSLGVGSLYYPDDRLRDFAHANSIPVVTLAYPLAAYAAERGVYLNGGTHPNYPEGTGHWNHVAHQLAAEIVADRMCADSPVLAK